MSVSPSAGCHASKLYGNKLVLKQRSKESIRTRQWGKLWGPKILLPVQQMPSVRSPCYQSAANALARSVGLLHFQRMPIHQLRSYLCTKLILPVDF